MTITIKLFVWRTPEWKYNIALVPSFLYRDVIQHSSFQVHSFGFRTSRPHHLWILRPNHTVNRKASMLGGVPSFQLHNPMFCALLPGGAYTLIYLITLPAQINQKNQTLKLKSNDIFVVELVDPELGVSGHPAKNDPSHPFVQPWRNLHPLRHTQSRSSIRKYPL